MRILVTAGPTREYIDSVRFISNSSSGKMGFAVAEAALTAGHCVTLLTGPVAIEPPSGVQIVRFETIEQLKSAMRQHFCNCDALVMTAAVGDFKPAKVHSQKLSRKSAPITLTLTATDDVLAGTAAGKNSRQIIIAFAVEDGPVEQIQAKARNELICKHADYVVLNTPLAMGADESDACIMDSGGIVLPWASRPKAKLAQEIVHHLLTVTNQRQSL